MDTQAASSTCATLFASPVEGDAASKSLAEAWVELYQLGRSTDHAAEVAAWVSAGIREGLPHAQQLAIWFAPPSGLFPSDLDASFVQLRSYFEAASLTVSDGADLENDLARRIGGFIRLDLESVRVAKETSDVRGRPLRFTTAEIYSVGGRAGLFSGYSEMPDGRIAFSGYRDGDSALSILDRNRGSHQAVEIADAALFSAGGMRGGSTVQSLRSGGCVVTTMDNTVIFFAADGTVLAHHQHTRNVSGNRTRAVELTDGTVAVVDMFNRLHFYRADGTEKSAPITAPGSLVLVNPVALPDGNVAVASSLANQDALLIYGPQGEEIARIAAKGAIRTQPIVLRDGAIAFADEGNHFMVVHRSNSTGSYETEFQVAIGTRIENAIPVELADGTIALATGQQIGWSRKLNFISRTSGRVVEVKVQFNEGDGLAALPDGGVAAVAGGRLMIFNSDGDLMNSGGSEAQGDWLKGTPLVVHPPDALGDDWVVVARTERGVFAANSLGVPIAYESFWAEGAGSGNHLTGMHLLNDGSVMVLEAAGRARVFHVEGSPNIVP